MNLSIKMLMFFVLSAFAFGLVVSLVTEFVR